MNVRNVRAWHLTTRKVCVLLSWTNVYLSRRSIKSNLLLYLVFLSLRIVLSKWRWNAQLLPRNYLTFKHWEGSIWYSTAMFSIIKTPLCKLPAECQKIQSCSVQSTNSNNKQYYSSTSKITVKYHTEALVWWNYKKLF